MREIYEKQQFFINLLREYGALLDGHFLLTSGLHSGQYMEKFKVLPYPGAIQSICHEFALFAAANSADVVAAPALGGITLASVTGAMAGLPAVFTERDSSGPMKLKRTGFTDIVAGQKIALLEDVVTTGGSVLECANAVREAGGEIVCVSIIVDRSGGKFGGEFPGIPLLALVEMEIPTYASNECPLCKKGIELTKPGSRKIAPA